MRVAHLCTSFSRLSETFIYDAIQELDRQGIDCHVLTHQRINEKHRPFDNVTVVPWPGIWNARRLGYRALEIPRLRQWKTSSWPLLRTGLEEELARPPPDAIHAHFGPSGVLVMPVAQALGVPLVVSFHGFDAFQLPQEKMWRKRLAALFRKAAAVTVVSRVMKKHLIQLGSPPERTHVVRVGKRMSDYPFQPRSGRGIKRWVSVGRMTEKKGHLDGLAAFKQVSEAHPALSLRIIGEGELLPEARAYIARNEMDGRVKLLGAVPHADVKREMAHADAFLLCSKTARDGDQEGIPTVLMEAQALGLPCVTTRHSGIPEVIPEENHGLLAEEGDVNGIADCMSRLMSRSPEQIREIAARGRAKVEAEFDLVREVEKLKAIYQSVAAST